MLYNICYGIGVNTSALLRIPVTRYVTGSQDTLYDIAAFIAGIEPDIAALVEVDCGSLRARRVNQAEVIAGAIGHYSCYECKYGKLSLNRVLPIVRKQGNAFLAAHNIHNERFHYFSDGVKRLIIELEMEEYAIFLVHLSLNYRHRQLQLRQLYDLVERTRKPVIVAGDLNTFKGGDELKPFLRATGLVSANDQNTPSWPSWNPVHELDFILYGDGIDANHFEVRHSPLSDHLPLVFDFSVR